MQKPRISFFVIVCVIFVAIGNALGNTAADIANANALILFTDGSRNNDIVDPERGIIEARWESSKKYKPVDDTPNFVPQRAIMDQALVWAHQYDA